MKATTANDVTYEITQGSKGYDLEITACFLEDFVIEEIPTEDIAKRFAEIFDANIDMLYYVELEELIDEVMEATLKEV